MTLHLSLETYCSELLHFSIHIFSFHDPTPTLLFPFHQFVNLFLSVCLSVRLSVAKVQLGNHIYDLVDRYVRKLDQELQKYKMELEADNAGITETLEQKCLKEMAAHPQVTLNSHKSERRKEGSRKKGRVPGGGSAGSGGGGGGGESSSASAGKSILLA